MFLILKYAIVLFQNNDQNIRTSFYFFFKDLLFLNSILNEEKYIKTLKKYKINSCWIEFPNISHTLHIMV
jgi:hypothetical protein